MTGDEFRKHRKYQSWLCVNITGFKWVQGDQEYGVVQMETALLTFIIEAAGITSSSKDLKKLGKYLDWLIKEYRNRNDVLYKIFCSYDAKKAEDERTKTGYISVDAMQAYQMFYDILYVLPWEDARTNMVLERQKQRTQLEYLKVLKRKYDDLIEYYNDHPLEKFFDKFDRTL